jgi:hypothetical protein
MLECMFINYTYMYANYVRVCICICTYILYIILLENLVCLVAITCAISAANVFIFWLEQ